MNYWIFGIVFVVALVVAVAVEQWLYVGGGMFVLLAGLLAAVVAQKQQVTVVVDAETHPGQYRARERG